MSKSPQVTDFPWIGYGAMAGLSLELGGLAGGLLGAVPARQAAAVERLERMISGRMETRGIQ